VVLVVVNHQVVALIRPKVEVLEASVEASVEASLDLI